MKKLRAYIDKTVDEEVLEETIEKIEENVAKQIEEKLETTNDLKMRKINTKSNKK